MASFSPSLTCMSFGPESRIECSWALVFKHRFIPIPSILPWVLNLWTCDRYHNVNVWVTLKIFCVYLHDISTPKNVNIYLVPTLYRLYPYYQPKVLTTASLVHLIVCSWREGWNVIFERLVLLKNSIKTNPLDRMTTRCHLMLFQSKSKHHNIAYYLQWLLTINASKSASRSCFLNAVAAP